MDKASSVICLLVLVYPQGTSLTNSVSVIFLGTHQHNFVTRKHYKYSYVNNKQVNENSQLPLSSFFFFLAFLEVLALEAS